MDGAPGSVEGSIAAAPVRVRRALMADLVAEELDPHGPVLPGRVDIENAAAQSHLPRHLDHINARVPDREQMLDEHIGQVFLAGAELKRERGIVVARE